MAWIGDHEFPLEEGFSIRQTLPPSWTFRQLSAAYNEAESGSSESGAFSRQELGFCYRRLSQGSSDNKYSPRLSKGNCTVACSLRVRELESQVNSLSDINESLKISLRREQQNIEVLSRALHRADDELRAVSELCSKALQDHIQVPAHEEIVFEYMHQRNISGNHSQDGHNSIEADLQPLKQVQRLCTLTDKLRQDVETSVSTILTLEPEVRRLREQAASRQLELDGVKEVEMRNFSLNQEVEYLRSVDPRPHAVRRAACVTDDVPPQRLSGTHHSLLAKAGCRNRAVGPGTAAPRCPVRRGGRSQARARAGARRGGPLTRHGRRLQLQHATAAWEEERAAAAAQQELARGLAEQNALLRGEAVQRLCRRLR